MFAIMGMGTKSILAISLITVLLIGAVSFDDAFAKEDKPKKDKLTKLQKECAKEPKKENKIKAHCELLELIGGEGGLLTQIEELEQKVLELETLTGSMTADANNVYFTGINLQIRDGTGDTQCAGPCNGLGNLIIGYDESRTSGSDKSGSHNFVVGMNHNYQSFGGVVVGFENTVSGAFSSVSGGNANEASGDRSSVSGGNNNIASGTFSSVVAGFDNEASGRESSVSGGVHNEASGLLSSVSGGGVSGPIGTVGNVASGEKSSVSGGQANVASGAFSSVSGGLAGIASGIHDWIAGALFQDN